MRDRLVIALALASFVAGFGAVALVDSATSEPQGIHAQWASSASSVFEQMGEADAVVRVRAIEQLSPRIFTKESPDGRHNAMIFTDTRFEVLEVYSGDVPAKITVLQTGGKAPRTKRHPALDLYMEEDPLYVAGTEHVLFLKDISGDAVHAPDRQLYRIVNPAGRYMVDGPRVTAMAKVGAAERPTLLSGLESQIGWARQQRDPLMK